MKPSRYSFPWMVAASALVVAGLSTEARGADAASKKISLKFDFGSGAVMPGYTQVLPARIYAKEPGFGFEPGAEVTAEDRGGDALRGDFITSDKPFFFSADVPEGNYRVTVILGDKAGETTTTIKAELRRLMIEKVQTARGKFQTRTFIVNTRNPRIRAIGEIAPGEVKLKAPRETTQESWAWDDRLTLEFNNERPTVCALEIESVDVPTIFLLGDSTVCDQSREPFNSWGQMLTRFFKPEIAIANHGESGETYRDSLGRRRLDKVLCVMKPGDFLFMQFGHNDQKQQAAGTGGPFTTYKEEMKRHIAGVRARGGIPVLVTPMNRRTFDESGKVTNSLGDYPEAVRQVAVEQSVVLIDLNAMSRPLYEALGPEKSALAFAAPGGNVDGTHHNNYGSYELAKCIVKAIRETPRLGLAKYLADDVKRFDPARPDPVEDFDVPPSPVVTMEPTAGELNHVDALAWSRRASL